MAAITDFHPDYTDACGTCFEIACDQTWIHDNYGKQLDRTYSCYDTSQVRGGARRRLRLASQMAALC